jgi:diacylglycerol kinase
MNEDDFRRRSWAKKFRDAFRGARQGVRGQGSFFVHVFFVAAVVLSAMALRVERIEWCALVLCITIVLAAEMFNSALEAMARTIDAARNADLRDALDIGSAAVLLCAVGAAAVGLIVFLHRLGFLLEWRG